MPDSYRREACDRIIAEHPSGFGVTCHICRGKEARILAVDMMDERGRVRTFIYVYCINCDVNTAPVVQ